MSEFDFKALQQQMEEMQRRMGVLPDAVPVAPRKPWAGVYSEADCVELAKFEQFESAITHAAGRPPGNPRVGSKPYPRMLYRAERDPNNGKWCVSMDRPEEYQFMAKEHYERALEQYKKFAESCIRVVNSESEHAAAAKDGWCESAGAAVEWRDRQNIKISDETAERHYRDSKMSEAARAEVEQFEAENPGHQPEVPEAPRRRPGRPRKDASPAA